MPIQVDISFKQPVTVLNQVQFQVAQRDGVDATKIFEMWQGNKVCSNGTIGAPRQ